MIQRKLANYFREESRIDKGVLGKLKKLAEKHSIQYALLWYIYLSRTASLRELSGTYPGRLYAKILLENSSCN